MVDSTWRLSGSFLSMSSLARPAEMAAELTKITSFSRISSFISDTSARIRSKFRLSLSLMLVEPTFMTILCILLPLKNAIIAH